MKNGHFSNKRRDLVPETCRFSTHRYKTWNMLAWPWFTTNWCSTFDIISVTSNWFIYRCIFYSKGVETNINKPILIMFWFVELSCYTSGRCRGSSCSGGSRRGCGRWRAACHEFCCIQEGWLQIRYGFWMFMDIQMKPMLNSLLCWERTTIEIQVCLLDMLGNWLTCDAHADQRKCSTNHATIILLVCWQNLITLKTKTHKTTSNILS